MTTNHTEEAQELLDSRLAVYGERVTQMTRVAQVFSGILGTEVRPDQVPLLMVGYKTVRASQTPDYEDNVKDIEGYAIMFREIIGDDMIAAVNTDEYLEKKAGRDMQKELDEMSVTRCRGCNWVLPATAPAAHRHAPDCPIDVHNRHVRAYNGRYEDEQPVQEPTPAQAVQLQKEVPSYQPGPVQEGDPQHHLDVYRKQLTDIFHRAWQEQTPVFPQDEYAEIAAREAVEFFWLTFKRNEQLQANIRALKTL